MATFVGRLRKGKGHIGESLGRGLTEGLQLRGERRERQRILGVEKDERDRQRAFMQDFGATESREEALELPNTHPEVFPDVQTLKIFHEVVDQKFPEVEEPDVELTEAVSLFDTELQQNVSYQVTASQQVELSEGKDPSEMSFARGADLTFGGKADELYKFFNDEDKFMGEFTVDDGKSKGFTSEFTRAEIRRVSDSKDEGGISPEFRTELLGALLEQGNENPTESDIRREAFFKSELANSTKALQIAFNGTFEGESFLHFPDALSGARFGMAIDIQNQMIRQGLSTSRATRISKAIAVAQIPAKGDTDPVAISIKVLEPVANEARMRVNVPYKVRNSAGDIAVGIYEVKLTNGKFIIIDGRTI